MMIQNPIDANFILVISNRGWPTELGHNTNKPDEYMDAMKAIAVRYLSYAIKNIN